MTSLALLVSRSNSQTGLSKDPFCSQRVQIVLWACTIPVDSAGKHEDTKTKELTYFEFWDHPRQFNHLDALLHRLAPIQVMNVATTEKGAVPSSKLDEKGNQSIKGSSKATSNAQAKDQMTSVLKRLMAFLHDRRNDYMGSSPSIEHTEIPISSDSSREDHHIRTSSTAALETVLELHSNIPTVDNARLQSVLRQLLVHTSESDSRNEKCSLTNSASTASPNAKTPAADTGGNQLSEASLRVAGDVTFFSNPLVLRGITFWLHCAGQWPSPTENSCYRILPGHLNSFLHLDRTAAEAIHLWPPSGSGRSAYVGGHKDNNSLAGLLTKNCQTLAGVRLIESWLRQPLVQLNPLLERQEAIQLLLHRSVERDRLQQEGLRLFHGSQQDLARLAANLGQYSSIELDEVGTIELENENQDGSSHSLPTSARRALQTLYQLYLLSTQKIPALTEALHSLLSCGTGAQDDMRDSFLLHNIFESLLQMQEELKRSTSLVEAVLDLEAAPREFLIKPDYKEELEEVVQELNQIESAIETCHTQMNELWAQSIGSSNSQAIRLETGGEGDSICQFRLPNTNDSKVLQTQLGSIVTVHRLLKNGVYFSTKELRQLSQRKHDLRAEYEKHQIEVVCDAMKIAATYQSVVERANSKVAVLDALVSLAHLAAYSPNGYCRPELTDGEEDGLGIALEGARHPCVELQENIDYIPNDIHLEFGKSSFLIVTGPNMGGKSTYIRALGAIVTMAQIGSCVPCKTAKINLCHHILARVGAGDLQERGISTFMAEMLESGSILRAATKRSLLIIDELGRGTSTFDGYGLARAISEYIVQKIGCMSVFATHFHELTELADKEATVSNCHVSAQKGNQGLVFLYEIRPGPCVESFGILVAEMARVPERVIRDAKAKARELENFGSEKEKNCDASWLERFRNVPREQLLKYLSKRAGQALSDKTLDELFDHIST